jgi:hypothetical protein
VDAIQSPPRRSSLISADSRTDGGSSQKSSGFWNRLKNTFTKKSTGATSTLKIGDYVDDNLPSPRRSQMWECADSSSEIGSIEDEEVEDCYYVYTPEEYVGEIVSHEDITQAQLGDKATQELVVDLKNHPTHHPQLVMFGETLFTIRPFGDGECVPYIPEYMRMSTNQQARQHQDITNQPPVHDTTSGRRRDESRT